MANPPSAFELMKSLFFFLAITCALHVHAQLDLTTVRQLSLGMVPRNFFIAEVADTRKIKDDDIPLKKNYANTNGEEYSVFKFYADYMGTNDAKGVDYANEIGVLKGREWDEFDFEMQREFLSTRFLVTPQSDRMGYKLSTKEEGRRTKDEGRSELISSGVCFGTVQVLPDNQLIILMADHQTTGGYPRIAHVISAHHSRLSQKRPGEYLKFKLVSLEEAEALLDEQEDYLSKLEYACKLKGYAY